jgi:hypothetical protein
MMRLGKVRDGIAIIIFITWIKQRKMNRNLFMYLFIQLICDGTLEKLDFWSAFDDIRLDSAVI